MATDRKLPIGARIRWGGGTYQIVSRPNRPSDKSQTNFANPLVIPLINTVTTGKALKIPMGGLEQKMYRAALNRLLWSRGYRLHTVFATTYLVAWARKR